MHFEVNKKCCRFPEEEYFGVCSFLFFPYAMLNWEVLESRAKRVKRMEENRIIVVYYDTKDIPEMS